MAESNNSLLAGLLNWLQQFRLKHATGLQRVDKPTLTRLFAQLGCDDPEGWASSQIDEGINQLGRFLFIRQAWAAAVPADSTDWIDAVLQECSPDTASGAAWRRLLASGADRKDLARIVRDAQGEMIFSICHVIDDPEPSGAGVADFRWGLFQIDAASRCLSPITFLHESVFELDPRQ